MALGLTDEVFSQADKDEEVVGQFVDQVQFPLFRFQIGFNWLVITPFTDVLAVCRRGMHAFSATFLSQNLTLKIYVVLI